MTDKIREALAGMLAIVEESRGVDGYHLNGDTAEWDEFPEVEAARAALAQQPAPAALCTAPPAAEQAPRELFTCIDKGGRYELLGESSGAGGCRREGRVIYRCLDTGQLYHRTDDDFAARMAPLNEEGKA